MANLLTCLGNLIETVFAEVYDVVYLVLHVNIIINVVISCSTLFIHQQK